jgi:hypothetical protein
MLVGPYIYDYDSTLNVPNIPIFLVREFSVGRGNHMVIGHLRKISVGGVMTYTDFLLKSNLKYLFVNLIYVSFC